MIEMDHWYGVVAAAGCGLGFRFATPILTATGLLGAVGIASACLIALLDACD